MKILYISSETVAKRTDLWDNGYGSFKSQYGSSGLTGSFIETGEGKWVYLISLKRKV
ncbi:MAG: hypothetical protein IKK33_01835 [Lachnospiraceae bacterium]|nr:hypothetical protein [Lachnospiraceae bacterium]